MPARWIYVVRIWLGSLYTLPSVCVHPLDLARSLVTRTVVDLVAGSDITFEDRGKHELKGVPAPWRLFAVKS
jgi:hypothetical protein